MYSTIIKESFKICVKKWITIIHKKKMNFIPYTFIHSFILVSASLLQCYWTAAIAFNSTSKRISLRWKTATLFPFAAVAQRFLPEVMRCRAGKRQGCWFLQSMRLFHFLSTPFSSSRLCLEHSRWVSSLCPLAFVQIFSSLIETNLFTIFLSLFPGYINEQSLIRERLVEVYKHEYTGIYY